MSQIVRLGLYLDDADILDRVTDLSWVENADATFSTISFNAEGLDLIDKLDPELHHGDPRLHLIVGLNGAEQHHYYLLEDRSPDHELPDTKVAVWGRDESAVLDELHAGKIDLVVATDTSAAAVAEAVVAAAWKANGISWDVEHYKIFANSLSMIEQSPITVLQRLCEPVKAGVRYSRVDRKLHFWRQPWRLTEAICELTITDLDHVDKASDQKAHGPGINRIHVVGWGGGNATIDIEAEEIESEPSARYLNIYAEPLSLLETVQAGTTNGGITRSGPGLGRNLAFVQTGELWDFRGSAIQAQFPLAAAPTMTWFGTQAPILSWSSGSRSVAVVGTDDDDQYMSIGLATYTTRRTRFKLTGITDDVVKVQAWNSDD